MKALSETAHSEEGPLASINIIPFVDIVLVLLIIFMLTSAAIVRGAIKVDLPSAASAGTSVPSTLNLVIGKDGSLLFNGSPSTEEKAAVFIKAESTRNAKVQAVIAADKEVAYKQLMRIIDLVKTNGVTSFALDVERGSASAVPSP